MAPSTATDDGFPVRCEICGTSSQVDVSRPPGDAVCPACGSFLWVTAISEVAGRSSFVPDVRISQLKAVTRDEAFQEASHAIAQQRGWPIEHETDLVKAFLAREALGSTTIGRGIAIPQANVDWLEQSVTAIAFAPDGIKFNGVDHQRVHTLIFIVAPKSQPQEPLRLLDQVSHALRTNGLTAD